MKTILFLIIFSLSGCGTVITFYEVDGATSKEFPSRPRIYSGVVFDANCVTEAWFITERNTEGYELYCILDFPLSFAADTIVLPYTIFTQIEHGSYEYDPNGLNRGRGIWN